jgi:hypothetical protein
MVPNSTIERKIMSTKTSIKRIALVAAAALTLGGFSAVSAQAATNTNLYVYTADGISAGAGTSSAGNGVAGVANSVQVAVLATASKDSYVAVSGGTVSSADTTTAVVSTDGKSVTRAAANLGVAILTVPTPSVGTITLSLYTGTNGIYGTTAAETVVITVGAAKSSGVYSAAKSTIFLAKGETSTAVAADATVVMLKTASAIGDSATAKAAGTIQVFYADTLGAAMPRESLTATIISGPGVIATTAAGVSSDSTTAIGAAATTDAQGAIKLRALTDFSASAHTSAAGWANFVVYPNNQSGVSTIVVKNSAGTEIGRKTILFTSTTVASYTITQKKSFIQGDTAAETTGVVAIKLFDSSANAIVGLAYAPTITYATGSKTVTANVDTGTSDANGEIWYGFTPTAATYGSVTATFTDPTTATITGSITFTLSSVKASTLTINGPASASVGDPISYTLTAKDANGYAVPDGTAASVYLNATPASGTAGVTSFDATAKTVAGVATVKSAGATVAATAATVTFTLEGTAGVADSYLVSTLAGTTQAVVIALSGTDASSLAYDAASAATDAANNAYEEAQNATQAASDALAAVKALAVQVKALIALVNKIKAKLKA